MCEKSPQDRNFRLSDLNKKINEIKKKIQLSEGQRKALFEDCETERKLNADEIIQLKKEISQLVVNLHESKSPYAKYRLKNKRVEEIVGPVGEKTFEEVKRMLDLQIIARSKKFDLLRFKMQKRKKRIEELGEQYHKILSKVEKKELKKNVEKPVKKATCELQNNIHAVEVQIREALHIRNRYVEIKKSLMDDSAKFGSNINKLEEELQSQNEDTKKLQKIMEEATRRRAKARGNLLREEKAVTTAANLQEKEAAEGKRLVNDRKNELERLEKKIFQIGKIPPRPEPEGAENDEEKSPLPPHPVEVLAQEFEVLKQATGGTTTEEVLKKFQAQKETQERLNILRNKSEDEKNHLAKKLHRLRTQLESHKYTESKDSEKNILHLENIQIEIEKYREISRKSKENEQEISESTKNVLIDLHTLYLCVNPLALPEEDPLETVQKILNDLQTILNKIKTKTAQNKYKQESIYLEPPDDKLPAPYNSLLRRTPLSQPGTSPAPPPATGSEDEEEVPSRGYLKRQAQLVIDAKTRRKNIRLLPQKN